MSLESLFRGLFTNADGVDRGPAIQEHREPFSGTEFVCECGGHVYAFSLIKGLCVSCKSEPHLEDLEYNSTHGPEDATANH